MDINTNAHLTHLANAYLPALTATLSLPSPWDVTTEASFDSSIAKKKKIFAPEFDSFSFIRSIYLLCLHRFVYLQLTVPLTCTDMRFILFIDNLLTLY